MTSATSTDATPPQAARRPSVLYVCTHNAGRSALAAALTRARAGDRLHAESAGTSPPTPGRARSRSPASPRSASTTPTGRRR